MDFDDPGWTRLLGGYRLPYDPRPALRTLESGEGVAAAWKELWNELHHQGDVGEASYAAVPHLVRIHSARGVPDWNTYALVAVIDDGDGILEIPRYREAFEIPMKPRGSSWSR